MSEPGENHQLALDIFLNQHPELRAELDTLNPLAAQAKRQTMEQYRRELLHEAFEAQAESQNLFAWELTLQQISQSPQEFAARRLEVHREVAQMAGLEWGEYCQLHGLAEHSS